jgi:hypothetical protein
MGLKVKKWKKVNFKKKSKRITGFKDAFEIIILLQFCFNIFGLLYDLNWFKNKSKRKKFQLKC